MALEALSSNDLLNFLCIYDTICASDHLQSHEYHHSNQNNVFLMEKDSQCPQADHKPTQGRKKRKRRQKVCANKEEAETQRLTHIVVERNRRKQMNEHLSALKSLMPESYVQKVDQASIVACAIDYVKELEHQLQTLEAQKCVLEKQQKEKTKAEASSDHNQGEATMNKSFQPPFAQFFMYPQYQWCQLLNGDSSSQSRPSIADIEVTMIETHASLRIFTSRRPRQLVKMVSAFHSIGLTVLHLNATTLDSLVLYSISAKVEEEGCILNSVEEIAGAVHHMLTVIADEAALCRCNTMRSHF